MSAVEMRKRPASVALEVLLLAPIVLVFFLAMVEVSLIVVADQRLEAASALGARQAAIGASKTQVETAVKNALGQGGTLQTAVQIQITTLDSADAPVITDPTLIAYGKPVIVTAFLPDATAVVPDLLKFIAFSIKNQLIIGQTTLMKEVGNP